MYILHNKKEHAINPENALSTFTMLYKHHHQLLPPPPGQVSHSSVRGTVLPMFPGCSAGLKQLSFPGNWGGQELTLGISTWKATVIAFPWHRCQGGTFLTSCPTQLLLTEQGLGLGNCPCAWPAPPPSQGEVFCTKLGRWGLPLGSHAHCSDLPHHGSERVGWMLPCLLPLLLGCCRCHWINIS